MKLFLNSALFLALAAASAVPKQRVNYDGYKVLRVAYNDEVESLIQKNNIATWIKESGNIDVVIPPGVTALDHLDAKVMHEDLGVAVAENLAFAPAAAAADITWFNSYHAYADHLTFLTQLVAAHPSNAEIVSVGKSLEGRTITGIHFWGTAKGKPAVLLHGTVHAREWIGTMVTEYFAYNLLTNYSTDSAIKALVDKYDFYILPIVNPDGFVFTQSSNRLWRKNRQTTSGSTCLGHDINRNWNFKWSTTGGASTNPCAEDFKGLSAADAPETQVLQAFSNKLSSSGGLKLFIDYHSYSQLFMTPYGYSCTAVAPNNAVLQSLAKGAVAAMKTPYGTVFDYGPICTTIYPATGSSVDYNNDVAKSQYTFTVELRDTGNYGFVLPANQILPSGIEAYAGLAYLLRTIT